jgi:serine/threonine protein phosphatase PrpC
MYWFRAGKLLRRTRDHSLVQSLVDAGILAETEVRSHPKRSELRSALGLAGDILEVSAGDGREPVLPGDVFLLCTDGLWEYVEDGELEATLAASETPRRWLDLLRDRVMQAAGHKTSHDNFTALAVWAS